MFSRESLALALVVLAVLGLLAPFHSLAPAAADPGAMGPKDPPVFDYQISFSPGSARLVAGQSMVVLLNMSLVSGTPQNVTLLTRITPTFALTDTTAQLQPLNVTSGFPPFWARLPITTNPYYAVCFMDPCTGGKQYLVTVIGMTSTSVDHNATLALMVEPTPSPAQPPDYQPFIVIGVVVAAGFLTTFFLTTFIFSRHRKRRPTAIAQS